MIADILLTHHDDTDLATDPDAGSETSRRGATRPSRVEAAGAAPLRGQGVARRKPSPADSGSTRATGESTESAAPPESTDRPRRPRRSRATRAEPTPIVRSGARPGSKLALLLDIERLTGERSAGATSSRDVVDLLRQVAELGDPVVQKAYAEWDHWAELKDRMYGAAVDLIEMPRSRSESSPDGSQTAVRVTVDALEVCFTKPHVNGFVLALGRGSEASQLLPLLAKLREHDRRIVGLWSGEAPPRNVAEQCERLLELSAAGTEREPQGRPRNATPGGDDSRTPEPGGENGAASERAEARPAGDGGQNGNDEEVAVAEAFELLRDTIIDLGAQRKGPLWGSAVKQRLCRIRPDFDERALGFRTFSDLLREAEKRGFVTLESDAGRGRIRVQLA